MTMVRSTSIAFLVVTLFGVTSPADETNNSDAEAELPAVTKNTVGAKLRLIPAGEFMMGTADELLGQSDNDRPRHRVRISRPFYMSETEVTRGQWRAVMDTQPWLPLRVDGVLDGDNYPVCYCKFAEMEEFCRRLSEREQRKYRLPTEAEWEYACRGGTSTLFSFGDKQEALDEYGWYFDNAYKIGEKYPHEVALKKPNPFGLYDMHGNVWEMCSDWSSETYYRESPLGDPTGPATGEYHVVRGGSMITLAWHTRSANRFRYSPKAFVRDLGFRVVLEAQ